MMEMMREVSAAAGHLLVMQLTDETGTTI